ncbi:hypothetical protein [Streptomyces sp. NPDC003719]
MPPRLVQDDPAQPVVLGAFRRLGQPGHERQGGRGYVVEETGHTCGDVVPGEGDLHVRRPPDLLEPGPYGRIGEDVQQQVGIPEGGVTVEGRPGDHGCRFHHRLVVAQHPAQHCLHRAGEPVPAAG